MNINVYYLKVIFLKQLLNGLREETFMCISIDFVKLEKQVEQFITVFLHFTIQLYTIFFYPLQ